MNINTIVQTVIRTSLLAVVCSTFVACDKKTPTTPNYQEIETARSAMVTWLECEECTEGELKSVLAHSKRLQPMLISTLNKGVAPASMALYRVELEKRYDELVAASRSNPRTKPTLSKDKFVQLYLGNFSAQYKVRSAQALSAIGGEKSKQAIKEALGNAKREDVRKELKQALEKAK